MELFVGNHIFDGVDRRPEEIWFCKAFAHSSSGLVAKMASSSPMSSTALAARDRPVDVATVRQPVGSPDRAAQRGPVAIAL